MTRRTATRSLFVGVGAAGALAILRPWTIRPIAPAHDITSATETADDLWNRVVVEATATAIDVSSSAGAPSMATTGRRAWFVKGQGTVTGVDAISRARVARVTLDDHARSVVSIQIGPVVRGSAVRDAATFIEFSNFPNQSAFAAVSTALNDRVLRDVLGSIDPASLDGRRVEFVGAATNGTSGLDVVPVVLHVSPARS